MANSYQKYMPQATNENASSLVQIKMEYEDDEMFNDGAILSYQSTVKTENPKIHDPPSEIKAQPGTLRVKPFAALADMRVQSQSVEPPTPYYFDGTNYVRVKVPNRPQQILSPAFGSSEPRQLTSQYRQLANNGMWLPASAYPPELPNHYWPFLDIQSAEMYKRLNTTFNCYYNPGNARQNQRQSSRAFSFNYPPEPVACPFSHHEMASPNVTTFPRHSLNRAVFTQSPCGTNMPMASCFPHDIPRCFRIPKASSPGVISSSPSQPDGLIPEMKVECSLSEDQLLTSQLNGTIQPNFIHSETSVKQEIDLGVDTESNNDQGIKPGTSTQVRPHFMGKAISNFQISLNSPNYGEQKIIGKLENVAGIGSTCENNVKDLQLYPPHIPKGKYKCKACDYRTSKSDGVKMHVSVIHTTENEFRCTHCYIKNESIHHLVHHFGKIHRNEKRWQCQKCGRSYRHKASYMFHKNTKCTAMDPYACHKCNFTCKSEETLQKHILNHMKDLKLPCQYCGKEIKQRALQTHIAVIHGGEKRFKCQQCDFASGTKGYLKVHYKKTRHDKLFSCQRCNFRCATSKGLETHVASHRKQASRKYVCEREGCGQVLQHARAFQKHQKLHSLPKDKLFICQVDTCKAMFDTQSALRLHYGRTRHHRPYQCPECVNRFAKESSCIKHYKVYHEMKALQKQQMVAEMNEAAVTSCEKSDEDSEEAGVSHFGMWLGISGFGSEFETMYLPSNNPVSSTACKPGSTLTIEMEDALVKSKIGTDSTIPRDLAATIAKIPENTSVIDYNVETPGDGIPQSKNVCRAGSSEVSGVEHENKEAHLEELSVKNSTTEISCVPDISDLLECKIECVGSDSDMNPHTNARNANNEKLSTEIGCLIEIKQEITPDEENITGDVTEGETVKTEKNIDNMVSDELDVPFLPLRVVMQ